MRVLIGGILIQDTMPTLPSQISVLYSDIVLIGPFGAGKTTIGRLLAERLGLPQASLDDLCYGYYEEIGWNGPEAKQIYEQQGGEAFDEYTNSFEPYGVEQVLARHRDCVFDFGGSHTLHDNPARFARVQTALAPYPNVVLLLPSPDSEASLRVLKARRRSEYLEYSVRHPGNYALAKHILYTEGKLLEQIGDEVLEKTCFPQF